MQPEWKDDGSKQARATMDKVGREILDKSKGNLQTSGEKVEKSARLNGRDILTLLLRANTATDIREHQRMSDDEVLARTSCWLFFTQCTFQTDEFITRNPHFFGSWARDNKVSCETLSIISGWLIMVGQYVDYLGALRAERKPTSSEEIAGRTCNYLNG